MSASLAMTLGASHPAVARSARSRAGTVVSLRADIAADRRQVVYALTLPEYLEAWLTPPDASAAREQAVMRAGTGYVLEYRDRYGRIAIIDGVFRACAHDNVVFTWQGQWPRRTRRTLVTVRLNESGGLTSLLLTHAGVMDDAEHLWLRDLWNLSLYRLNGLLGTGAMGAFDIPPVRNELIHRAR
jgi:uncharacterized protein YndB with AHSA1/START domain